MRKEEAKAIGDILRAIPDAAVAPLLNIGSSTLYYRTVSQPHIDREIFEPLRMRGLTVIHSDIKAQDGVDLVGDIFDPTFAENLRARKPRCILCSNVLEHVPDVDVFTAKLNEIADVETFLLLTVPYSYPLHLDPIDNRFRPTPHEIAQKFKGTTLINGQIIESGRYIDELKKLPFKPLLKMLLKSAILFWVPFYKYDQWKNRFHRYLWLFKRYSVSLALLQKTTSND